MLILCICARLSPCTYRIITKKLPEVVLLSWFLFLVDIDHNSRLLQVVQLINIESETLVLDHQVLAMRWKSEMTQMFTNAHCEYWTFQLWNTTWSREIMPHKRIWSHGKCALNCRVEKASRQKDLQLDSVWGCMWTMSTWNISTWWKTKFYSMCKIQNCQSFQVKA